jgi:hypothetical protein
VRPALGRAESSPDGRHRQESDSESNHASPASPDLGRFLAQPLVSEPVGVERRRDRVPSDPACRGSGATQHQNHFTRSSLAKNVLASYLRPRCRRLSDRIVVVAGAYD